MMILYYISGAAGTYVWTRIYVFGLIPLDYIEGWWWNNYYVISGTAGT